MRASKQRVIIVPLLMVVIGFTFFIFVSVMGSLMYIDIEENLEVIRSKHHFFDSAFAYMRKDCGAAGCRLLFSVSVKANEFADILVWGGEFRGCRLVLLNESPVLVRAGEFSDFVLVCNEGVEVDGGSLHNVTIYVTARACSGLVCREVSGVQDVVALGSTE